MTRRKLRISEYQSTRDTIDQLKDSREVQNDEDNEVEVLRLERKFERLRAKGDFLQQDYVQDIAKRLKSIILSITLQLQEQDDTEKRRKLKSDRSSYRRVLTWFSDDIESDLKEVSDRANDMLKG